VQKRANWITESVLAFGVLEKPSGDALAFRATRQNRFVDFAVASHLREYFSRSNPANCRTSLRNVCVTFYDKRKLLHEKPSCIGLRFG
jgi:hypothetical protein